MNAEPTDKRRLVIAALISAFLLAPGRETAGQTNALESLKSSRDMARLEIGATCVQREKDALKQYGKALDTLLAALKQKGDLDAYLVVETERKRLSAEGTVPADKDSVPALADAVRTCRKAVVNQTAR